MLVNKSIETPEGTIKFEGELETEELNLVIQIGLNWLFKRGMLPFVIAGEDDDSVIPGDINNIQ